MESSLKELLSQLAKNTKKAPGWIPLLMMCYLTFWLFFEDAIIRGHSVKDHKEPIGEMLRRHCHSRTESIKCLSRSQFRQENMIAPGFK
jgi:hypothetical protein